jgi:DNA polymerase-3 subunit delta'
MVWETLFGHDRVIERFRGAVRRGRLASSFLLVGPDGVGKRTFALKLAQSLLCERTPEADLDGCGVCPACQQVSALTHPDLQLVAKPADRSFIPIELFIGDREHRLREGLCHDIALKPFRGGRKVAIIDDADFLNQEGANCLLKTLEEPPPRSVLMLIGTSEQRQLPTIRSRCQIVRFRPLPAATILELLTGRGLVADRAQAERLAALSGGSLQRALELADGEVTEFRETLLQEFSTPDWDSVALAKAVVAFVEAAGKEAPPRRARANQVIGFAAEFYRQLVRVLSGLPAVGDEPLVQAVAGASRTWSRGVGAAAACVDRCLETYHHVLANVGPAVLLECWLDDLAAITRAG